MTANHHQLQWNDGKVEYSRARNLIQEAIYGETRCEASPTVYVKGLEKRTWLREILENIDVSIRTIDADFEDIDRLENLTATRAFRCGHHVKNCVMEK